MNTAYLNNILVAPHTPADTADVSAPIIVTCCGVYRMDDKKDAITRLDTDRPQGRLDYQLLYLHSGQGHFSFPGDENDCKQDSSPQLSGAVLAKDAADGAALNPVTLHAGQMVLFPPGAPQVYHYLDSDHTEVYWVHFTGRDVTTLLERHGLHLSDAPQEIATQSVSQTSTQATATTPSYPVCPILISSSVLQEYKNLFLDMITELQLGRTAFEDMLTLKLETILLLARRHGRAHFSYKKGETTGATSTNNAHKNSIDAVTTNHINAAPIASAPSFSPQTYGALDTALRYFNEHYHEEISIKDYAASLFLTPSWFIQKFREYTGQTPTQYITALRITNAHTLLAEANYSVGEIAAIVGYDDPLYFSRIFKKHTGYSPREYRQLLTTPAASYPLV